ncbi:4Fe-4S binding protein [Entomospira entomophila]|uniref:4Fe-4S binding protein n=1 Tax=Entomospira entomophila TaxID=2719988 RepID=A0A968GA46_9SPIO|nr:4Fe-4S dicluster domain-containing protein [Entomospira entomophilus]NIZ40717.1 4Fe-4S binding protein [Entomospira entomophilus]WDI34930.1 4Fe-4S binding protein [Entomospira entomophilus]
MPKHIAIIGNHCVSCGECSLICPVQAITMDRGLTAVVNSTICVGCSQCATSCPAGVITMQPRDS